MPRSYHLGLKICNTRRRSKKSLLFFPWSLADKNHNKSNQKSYKPISNPSINQITISSQFAFSAGSRSVEDKRHGSSNVLQLRGLIFKTKISLATALPFIYYGNSSSIWRQRSKTQDKYRNDIYQFRPSNDIWDPPCKSNVSTLTPLFSPWYLDPDKGIHQPQDPPSQVWQIAATSWHLPHAWRQGAGLSPLQ